MHVQIQPEMSSKDDCRGYILDVTRRMQFPISYRLTLGIDCCVTQLTCTDASTLDSIGYIMSKACLKDDEYYTHIARTVILTKVKYFYRSHGNNCPTSKG